MSNRIKKYDSYVHRPSTTLRSIKNISSSRKNYVQNSKTLSNGNHKLDKQLAHNQLSQTVNGRNSGHRSTNSALKIAMQSVEHSREHTNEAGILTKQFSDDNQVVYATTKRKSSRLQKAMYVIGAFVFAISTFTSMQTIFTNKQAQDQIATLGIRTDEQGVSEGTGNNPSESTVSSDAVAAYQVKNPEDPRYLRISALGIFSRIKNLGIDSAGAVDAPWNINDVGWYNGSVKPGSKTGSSLILGHVSGWTTPGVFKSLRNLKTGSQFEIEKGSGEIVTYEVMRSESIPLEHVEMSKILGTVEYGKHDLKLMTCGGKYNREAKTYEERFVVYAKHVN